MRPHRPPQAAELHPQRMRARNRAAPPARPLRKPWPVCPRRNPARNRGPLRRRKAPATTRHPSQRRARTAPQTRCMRIVGLWSLPSPWPSCGARLLPRARQAASGSANSDHANRGSPRKRVSKVTCMPRMEAFHGTPTSSPCKTTSRTAEQPNATRALDTMMRCARAKSSSREPRAPGSAIHAPDCTGTRRQRSTTGLMLRPNVPGPLTRL